MFYLMNKDSILMSFQFAYVGTSREVAISNDESKTRFINGWLVDRNAAKHRKRIKDMLESIGCNTLVDFCRLTHCLSLNDSMWVKEDVENTKWSDINLYHNDFNDIIARTAISLGNFGNIEISSTSPEWTTNGQFRKCWRNRDGIIEMVKRGANDSMLSPYMEVCASQVFSHLDSRSIEYYLDYIDGSAISVSKLFTNENIGLLPYSFFIENIGLSYDLDSIYKEYAKYGYEDMFSAMIVGDCITMNVDRHYGNFGWYILNDTLQRKTMAPIYDFNLCFFPFADTLSGIDNFEKAYHPVIKGNWVDSARKVLTDHLCAELINLKDLYLTCAIDNVMTEERLKQINIIKNVQIDRILGINKKFGL